MTKIAGLKCRGCGQLALRSFGDLFRAELLKDIYPRTAQKYAARVLHCSNPDCEMGLNKMFCPKCKEWKLKCDLWTYAGLKFACAASACGLKFTVVLKANAVSY